MHRGPDWVPIYQNPCQVFALPFEVRVNCQRCGRPAKPARDESGDYFCSACGVWVEPITPRKPLPLPASGLSVHVDFVDANDKHILTLEHIYGRNLLIKSDIDLNIAALQVRVGCTQTRISMPYHLRFGRVPMWVDLSDIVPPHLLTDDVQKIVITRIEAIS